MNNETIVAVFDTAAHADAAVSDLQTAGISPSAIERHAGGVSTTGTTGLASTSTAAAPREEGFWSRLFGGEPEHDTSVYERSVEGGSVVVAVRAASEGEATQITEVLERHSPVDLDARATGYGLATTSEPVAASRATTVGTAPATGNEALQLSEESLVVGKRLVNRGGTRIRRYVVETPVEEQVTLHDERVVVDRHPVTDGRPVDTAFTDNEKVIEMTETAEVPVVSKTARVVEEVGLRKEGVDRTETIRDTVRKEEVEVVREPGESVTTGTTTIPTTPLRDPKI